MNKTTNTLIKHFFVMILHNQQHNKNNISTYHISTIIKRIMLLHRPYMSNNGIYSNIDNNNFIIFYTNNISDNLRHSNQLIDKVLHQMKACIFDINTYYPLFYIEKIMKDNTSMYINNNVNSNPNLQKLNHILGTTIFDHSKVSVYINYIGSHIVLFYHNNEWHFYFKNNVYTFTINNHPILYEYVGEFIDELNIDYCYHVILVDPRIRKMILPPNEHKQIYLIKITQKYTLREVDVTTCKYISHPKHIYLSCIDELLLYLENMDAVNIINKKIIFRGLIVKINYGDIEPIYLSYDTNTYKKIMKDIPDGYNVHECYLKLYQNDKLNDMLYLVNESHHDIITRINNAMNTMSREILDIYHMTRNQKNSDIYNLLPNIYKKILYEIHKEYIDMKNNDNIQYPKKSINVNDIYNKLKKNTSIDDLIELYKQRDLFIISVRQYNISSQNDKLFNLIKNCSSTKLQSKLLSIS